MRRHRQRWLHAEAVKVVGKEYYRLEYKSATAALLSESCLGTRTGEQVLLGTPRRSRDRWVVGASCATRFTASTVCKGPGRLRRCGAVKEVSEQRKTLRHSVPPWGVLLDHRIHGKLVNVSRRGLAVETRQAPSSFCPVRMKVAWDRGRPVRLDVDIVWCRMIGVEKAMVDGVHAGMPGDSAPRFLLGLSCSDASLIALGAPREA